MTHYLPLYMQEGSYPAQLDRMWIQDVTGGTPQLLTYGSFAVSQHAAGANMTVDVAAGHGVFPGNFTASEGAYHFWSDAADLGVPIAAAPPTGQSRIDVVIAQIQNDFVDGGGNNGWITTIVTGVPAATGTQVAPAIPANAMGLANVLVGPQVTSIVTANITDIRPPVRSGIQAPVASGAPFTSFVDASGEAWVAKGGVNGGIWKKARDVLHCSYYRNTAFTVPAAWTNFGFDTPETDPYGLYNASTGVATFPVAGRWALAISIGATMPQGGQVSASFAGRLQCSTMNSNAAAIIVIAGGASSFYITGGTLQTQIVCAGATNPTGWPNQAGSRMSIDYLGTG